MVNARLIYIDGPSSAKNEISKIGAYEASLPIMYPKAIHLTMKLEGVSVEAAGIIKQEMLSKGGEAAVNKDVCRFQVDKSDMLLMGTYSQYKKLIQKLELQPWTMKEIAAEIKEVLEGVDKGKPASFECGKFSLPIGEKTYIMGILNVTPDSFYDGGKYTELEAAVKKAKEMVEEGADIIEVGGQSFKPGYTTISAEEEIERVVPVVEKLAKELNVPISVDTCKFQVAEKVLQAGAHIINDVWGLQKEKKIAELVHEYSAGIILMHNQEHCEYKDLMGDILKYLRNSIKIAENAGVKKYQMILDPGIGFTFGKNLEQHFEIMKKLKELNSLNLPVMLAPSRKKFIGDFLGIPVEERLGATISTIVVGISNGIDIIRVHDIKEMKYVTKITDRMVRSEENV